VKTTAALRIVTLAVGLAVAGGVKAQVASDPLEGLNRAVFRFNDGLDTVLLKPLAQGYQDLVPELARTGVSNFFGNIGDAWSSANHFLQGKLQGGLEMGMRFAANTVFGIAGILDPATEFGLTRRSEDFGQTLAVWGVPNGPYVVLPLLGPSTLRDSFALPLDRYGGSLSRFATDFNTYAVTTLQVVQLRSELLETTQLVDQASLDKYSFVRDAWLSRRLDQIYDGAPPLEDFDDGDDKKPEPRPGNKPKPAG
jgi:phospholipid-binding lipoprotein MlaA